MSWQSPPWRFPLRARCSNANIIKRQADLDTFVAKCHEAVCAQRDANKGRVVLTRGFATIPLPGIDVPFHSRFLLSGAYWPAWVAGGCVGIFRQHRAAAK
jgi:hypothetical protein